MPAQAEVEMAVVQAAPAVPEDRRQEDFVYLLFQAVRRRDLAFGEVLEEIDLSLPKWRAILTIQRIPCCSMGELSAYTTVDRTTLTRTVDQLVAEGLVQRVATPNDRRQVHLVLTDLGAEAYQAAVARLRRFNDQALRGVADDDVLRLCEVVQTVVRNLHEDPDWAESVIRFARASDA